MQIAISWPEVLLRLIMTFVAGAIIGVNRGEHGRPAGLRTTVLVGLTASTSLILANLLLGSVGKTPDSFVTMDVLRLPLGVLTGVGFIGAGAILHKGNLVVGVTTAATLWFTTMMGFCFGAGEIGLGLALLALGVLILWGLEWVESHWQQRQQATLTLLADRDAAIFDELLPATHSAGYRLSMASIKYGEEGEERSYQVHWRGIARQTVPPSFLGQFSGKPGVRRLEWTPVVKS